jgi:hypothetical protein
MKGRMIITNQKSMGNSMVQNPTLTTNEITTWKRLPGERRLSSKAFYMIPFEGFVIMFKLSCCSY